VGETGAHRDSSLFLELLSNFHFFGPLAPFVMRRNRNSPSPCVLPHSMPLYVKEPARRGEPDLEERFHASVVVPLLPEVPHGNSLLLFLAVPPSFMFAIAFSENVVRDFFSGCSPCDTFHPHLFRALVSDYLSESFIAWIIALSGCAVWWHFGISFFSFLPSSSAQAVQQDRYGGFLSASL